MKILLTGADGQLGRCLQDRVDSRAHTLHALTRSALNITDSLAVARTVARLQPDIIVNAAAYTAVDKAEQEPEMALLINAQGAANLASAAERGGAAMIQVSTDYVFDGNKVGAYLETDRTDPLGVYGRSKLQGEEEVRRRCRRHIVLRTSWVFSEYGQNFPKSMLRLGREGRALSVVDDQQGCPTYGGDLAAACLTMCEAQASGQAEYGVFHFAGDLPVSWFEFARAIFTAAAAQGYLDRPPVLRAIASEEYPQLARRPKNSVLDVSRFNACYGSIGRDWQAGLARLLPYLER